jgi:hypothetical protein
MSKELYYDDNDPTHTAATMPLRRKSDGAYWNGTGFSQASALTAASIIANGTILVGYKDATDDDPPVWVGRRWWFDLPDGAPSDSYDGPVCASNPYVIGAEVGTAQQTISSPSSLVQLLSILLNGGFWPLGLYVVGFEGVNYTAMGMHDGAPYYVTTEQDEAFFYDKASTSWWVTFSFTSTLNYLPDFNTANAVGSGNSGTGFDTLPTGTYTNGYVVKALQLASQDSVNAVGVIAGAIATVLSGITSLAKWLGLLAGKTADALTLAEMQTNAPAAATFDNTAMSEQALALAIAAVPSGPVTLAASQPNYAPAKAGDQMDLIDSPNANAVKAIATETIFLPTPMIVPASFFLQDIGVGLDSPAKAYIVDADHFTGAFSAPVLANAPAGGGGLTEQQVADALKLAPAGGSPADGSVMAELAAILNPAGDGPIPYPYKVTFCDGQPAYNCAVSVFLDESMTQQVPGTGTQFTGTDGVVNWWLSAGDYWFYQVLSGVDFSPNPVQETVSP